MNVYAKVGLVGALLLLGGCATVPSMGARQVAVVGSGMVSACKLLGTVTGSSVVEGVALGLVAGAAFGQQDPYGLNQMAQQQQRAIQQSRQQYENGCVGYGCGPIRPVVPMPNPEQYTQPYQPQQMPETGSQLGEEEVERYNAAHPQRQCYVDVAGSVICQ